MSATLTNYAQVFTDLFTVDTPVDTLWGVLRDKLLQTFVPLKSRNKIIIPDNHG